ncbi:MAG: lyase family protein [Candidatus Staskawiczbacteria bacterium]|nr:lyase family protein [Candidatus Staskawiczbacteria bacterium]
MIERYRSKVIAQIWEDRTKLDAWQKVELAVVEARSLLGIIPPTVFMEVNRILGSTQVYLEWWKEREEKIGHDLQAWVEERVRLLPSELQGHFHDGMTSYDTEETAFLMLLKYSANIVVGECTQLLEALSTLALKYRRCPMMAITHGQHAEVQTFGKRCLTWHREIFLARNRVRDEAARLNMSKLSGAVGNYGEITPEIEEKALALLGFKPFFGATQILPRQIHVPLASALATLVVAISKIGVDIRLGARSPRPIYQEPFGKSQKGSSAMPHKKNTISCEQLEGMERMALGYLTMIMQNISTWEERAIEQSSVERVAWPDLFHVVMRSLTVCVKVIGGLRVYPDNMIQDILDTKGTWAAATAKNFLRPRLVAYGISAEETYRIVQLASFNAFHPSKTAMDARKEPPATLKEARELIERVFGDSAIRCSIDAIIANASLSVVPELDATQEEVDKWNGALRKLFAIPGIKDNEWRGVFSVEDRLRNEDFLFDHVLLFREAPPKV